MRTNKHDTKKLAMKPSNEHKDGYRHQPKQKLIKKILFNSATNKKRRNSRAE
jgi:hypothetical protein